MDPELLPIVIALAAAAVTLLVVGVVLRRKGRRLADRLGPAFELGTVRPLGPFGAGAEGLYRGYTCRYLIQFASQHDRGGATLRVDASSPFTWSAERSGSGSRFLVSIGVLRDLEVGHEALDDRLRFATDDEDGLRGLLRVDSVPNALTKLVETDNFENVRVRPDRIDLRWSPRDAGLDEDPEVLRARLDATVDLLSATGSTPRLRAPM